MLKYIPNRLFSKKVGAQSQNGVAHANINIKLNSKMYFCLLALQLLNLATLVTQFHPLYLIFAIFAIALQVYVHVKLVSKNSHNMELSAAKTHYAAPKVLPPWSILLLAISGSVVIAISGKELGLLLSMIHLLCFAYSLKMFEIPSRKDLYQLVVLGIFVATSSLIFTQSIYFSLAVILLVFGNFIVLLNFFAAKMPLMTQAKLLGKLSFYALPIAILLFIGFPKLSPFWQVPNVKSATVGLSDSVKIGDISQLALSDELAFRVSFQDENPTHAQLYWRAMILDDFDGMTWRKKSHQHDPSQSNESDAATLNSAENSSNVQLQGSALQYQVIAEPSFQSWLFALDFATSEQGNIGRRDDFALFYRGIVSQTLSYQVASYPHAKLSPTLSAEARENNLKLTTGNNPKLLAKAHALRESYQDDQQLIRQVLADFNQQNYFYTLQPPALENNSLDQFYFGTKAGFCEHYASTFTYLMRAAGIPARMVVGYLGGELNPSGNYISVYQRNAHAWSEVWLADKGWTRIDPTASVDPERVERGFSNNLMQEYADLSSGLFSIQPLRAMWWYQQLKMQIDAIDYQWTRWVIGYSGKKQSQVLSKLIASLKQKFTWLLSLLILVSFIAWGYWRSVTKVRVNTKNKVNALYLQTLALMAQHNLVKPHSMTAKQFSAFITNTRPELSEHFSAISQQFQQVNYQCTDDAQREAMQKHMVQLKRNYRKLRWKLWLARVGLRPL